MSLHFSEMIFNTDFFCLQLMMMMMMMVKVSQNTNVKNDEMKEKRIYPNPIASKND